jgi:dTDP-4-dehydrorhamnose 3,5-epimerase
MKHIEVIETPLEGLLLLKPRVFSDARGYFYESWRLQDYRDSGVTEGFLQDNCSYSTKGVLRGLHIQRSQAQILWPVYGSVYQVLLDVRENSKTYGQHFGVELKHTEPTQVYMPPGFAGGFCVLSDFVCMNYKCTQYYSPIDEGGVLWSDPDLAIQWPITAPIVSERDQIFPQLKDLDKAVV